MTKLPAFAGTQKPRTLPGSIDALSATLEDFDNPALDLLEVWRCECKPSAELGDMCQLVEMLRKQSPKNGSWKLEAGSGKLEAGS